MILLNRYYEAFFASVANTHISVVRVVVFWEVFFGPSDL